MDNCGFPKLNEIPMNLYQMNNNIIPTQQNQFSLPLNINQVIQNNQNQILPLLFPEQLLSPNLFYLLPRLFIIPQPNQINYLNQLIIEQNLRNLNNTMNLNNNNMINNLIHTQKINSLNGNNLENILNNKNNNNNEPNKEKRKNELSNNPVGKKFFVIHEEPKPINSKNDLNNNNKNKSENNNIFFNSLKTEQPEELKNKLSLFTISNTNTNINNNNINNDILSKKDTKMNQFIKLLNSDDQKQIKEENNESNKYLFYSQNLEEKQEKDKIKYYRCSFKECNKVFPKQSNLKDHIRTHTGEKPYICFHPGCGKTFSQHGNLKKHEKIHLGSKKYYCTYPNCGKKFSASYNLKIHYRCHTGEKPYKCNFPNCGKTFYDKGNLKYHEKNMHALENMEYPYSCEHMGCNAKFKTKLEKLKHHCEMEIDCFKERKELIKLIQRYKIFFKKIIIKKGIDANKNEIVLKLKKNYEEIRDKLIDKELFKYYLGENFENECTNVEDIKNDNEEKKSEDKEENINDNEEEIKDKVDNEVNEYQNNSYENNYIILLVIRKKIFQIIVNNSNFH